MISDGPDGSQNIASAPPLHLSQISLFLDLDGTLAPIEAKPDQVGPDRTRNAVIRALVARLNGRLAVISGRTIVEIDRILAGAVVAVAGVHGLQRRDPVGRIFQPKPPGCLSQSRADLRQLAAAWPGVLIEDKGLSVAVHYRGRPEARELMTAEACRLAQTHGLAIQAGDQVIELRAPGPNKGDALRAFMGEPPFAGLTPVFVGDDLTDEVGFEAAARLGGYGVLVGARTDTRAQYRLPNPAGVLNWLDQAITTEPRP